MELQRGAPASSITVQHKTEIQLLRASLVKCMEIVCYLFFLQSSYCCTKIEVQLNLHLSKHVLPGRHV